VVLTCLSSYLLSAATVLVAELGDRTMVATTAFAVVGGRIFRVVTVSTAAFAIANLPVALAGALVSTYLDLKHLQLISALLFITVGVLIAFSKGDIGRFRGDATLTLFFLTVLLSELGDKSQLILLSLTLTYGCVPALTGAVTAYATVNIASATLFSRVLRKYMNSRRTASLIKYLASAFFITSGILYLLAQLA